MILPAASIKARCENAWGEVAEVTARVGVEFLGEQPERRGDPEELLHQVVRRYLVPDLR